MGIPASTLFALLLSAAVPSVSASSEPSPQPSDLPEIGHVKATSSCGMLSALVEPVSLVVERNDRDFVALKDPIARFANGTVGEAMPTIRKDPTAALDLDQSGNDANTYTPERTMAASNIDRISGEILTNLSAAEAMVNQSYKLHPDGSDPAYDAMRQRVLNVLELQRTLAFRLSDAAGAYSSNSGFTSFLDPTEVEGFQDTLDGLLGTPSTREVEADYPLVVDPALLPKGNVSGLKHGSVSAVGKALRLQKIALGIEAQRLARACDGLK